MIQNNPHVLAIGDAIGKGLIIFSIFLVSLYSDTTEFSKIIVGYSIISSSWFFLDLGVNIKAIRIGKNITEIDYKTLSSLRTLSSYILITSFAIFITYEHFTIAFFILGALFRVLSLDWVMRAKIQYLNLSKSTIVTGISFSATIIILILSNRANSINVSLSYALSYFIFFLSTRYSIKDFKIYFPRSTSLKNNFNSSLSFSFSGLFIGSLLHIPIFILSATNTSDYDIAKIGIIILFINSASFLISIYVVALMPLMTDSNKQVNSIILTLGAAASIIIVVGILIYERFSIYDFDSIQIIIISCFIFLYSYRRILDSKLLLNNGEYTYLLSSIFLSLLLIVSFSGLYFLLTDISLAYVFSIIFVEVIFLVILKKNTNHED